MAKKVTGKVGWDAALRSNVKGAGGQAARAKAVANNKGRRGVVIRGKVK